ncbi:hypothetical protein [Euhalothece natronophila]|uniref:hypothetical protein n=1 Tax=Euhalothece natronophila TaxID=577489 RepID=UPI001645F534|nr:hypothetical protein [Euhalothece natronophila]
MENCFCFPQLERDLSLRLAKDIQSVSLIKSSHHQRDRAKYLPFICVEYLNP